MIAKPSYMLAEVGIIRLLETVNNSSSFHCGAFSSVGRATDF